MMTGATVDLIRAMPGAPLSTYRIGGPLDAVVQPATAEGAVKAFDILRQDYDTITLLGWGSNTLIASAGIRGLVVLTRQLTGIEKIDETHLRCEAGVHLAKAATMAQQAGLAGGEFFIGIPGTIGGAFRMNAGAMGQDTKAIVESARVYDWQTGELETWPAARFGFDYRHSALDPHRHVVLDAVLVFEPAENLAAIRERMDANITFRKTHHPKEPNGGSVFRNPTPDQPAGKLLDELGAREWVEGGVRVSPLHANFIINHTMQGSSTDVLKLMRRMQLAIYEAHDILMHPENLFVGDATEEETGLWQALQGH